MISDNLVQTKYSRSDWSDAELPCGISICIGEHNGKPHYVLIPWG
jgi:hypothetical protein